jgi:hypothetical protein
MKNLHISSRFVLLSICSSVVFSSCFVNIGSKDSIIGNGNIQTIERQIAPFTKVENVTFADVNITTKAVQKLELTTDENLQEYFLTEVSNGKLIISNKLGFISTKTARFTISMQTLEELTNTGSGDISANAIETTNSALVGNTGSGDISVSAVQTPTLSVRGTGSGSTSLRGIATQTFTGSISGSGDVLLQGISTSGTLGSTGSGSMEARNFTLQRATARVSGSGGIRVSVVQNLDATITGSGSIIYYGSPTLSTSITGSGNVSRGN